MDRRNFIAAAGAAAALGAAASSRAGEAPANNYYEFRKYILAPGGGKQVLNGYLGKALIPALNRLGIQPVGAFTVQYGLNSPPAVFVLIPHKTLDSVLATPAKLLEDAEYMKAGEEFLNAPPDAPAFFRLETQLLRAFDKLPAIEQPVSTDVKSRFFELRIYESANPVKAKAKMKMFNEGGEIGLFKETGLNPVMFGETLVGPNMPNLHYMLCHENTEKQQAAWDAFRAHPGWAALQKDEQYKDSVSNISDIILKPTPFSQM